MSVVDAWNSLVEFFFASKDPSFFQTLLIAALSALMVQLLAAKPKLHWFRSHQFNYLMRPNQDQLLIRTTQYIFHNGGKTTIEELEIAFLYAPQHFEIWTPRQFEEIRLPQDRLLLRFPTLPPKEGFVLSLINLGPAELPDIAAVRTRNATVEAKSTSIQVVWPRWKVMAFYALALLGFAFLLQTAVSVLLTWNAITPATGIPA